MPKKAKNKTAEEPSTLITDEAVSALLGKSSFELLRDGLSPLTFEGHRLAEVTSYAPGPSLWYELAVYHRDRDYVLATHVFKKRVAEKDSHRAEAFPTLLSLCDALESYDASHDVAQVDDLTDQRISTAEAMIKAAALRQRVNEARMEHRAAAGELLTELARLTL